MEENIRIIEKPDWVSWNEIRECLIDAHEENRANGIIMSHYQWPAERIREYMGDQGVMWLAMDGNKVVGTAGLIERMGNAWYNYGPYAYLCFDGTLPSYRGQGINKRLSQVREERVRASGVDIMVLDTHFKNSRLQRIALKSGYRYVRFFRARSRDHYCVVMVKWLKGCPYSNLFCLWKYHISKIKTIVKTVLHPHLFCL